MSLTSLLDNSRSPVSVFFKGRFPNTSPFLAEDRKRMRAARPIRHKDRSSLSIIGMAMDYRIRYYFGVTPFRELAAYDGARDLTDGQSMPSSVDLRAYREGEAIVVFDGGSGKSLGRGSIEEHPYFHSSVLDGETFIDAAQLATETAHAAIPESSDGCLPLKPEYREFFMSLDNLLTHCSPVGARMERSDEDELNRHCIALASMEQIARVGLGRMRGHPLESFVPPLEIARPSWLEDMRELSWRFYDEHHELTALPHVLNPQFEGSADVGGADGDIIIDGTLLDIKTTVTQNIELKWLHQLFGYVLLDYSDSYQISAVGLYMTRQGILFRWELEDAIERLSGGSTDILSLREQFKNLVQS